MTERIGVAIAGFNGAVASTVVAGTELIRRGFAEPIGLVSEDSAVSKAGHLVSLRNIVFMGWDPRGETLWKATERNAVLDESQRKPIRPWLNAQRPLPKRSSWQTVRRDLRAFQRKHKLARVIVVALLPTEPVGTVGDTAIYARGALEAGCPFINFTPNAATELPQLRKLAEEHGLPFAGKDGKTGQTMMKSVLASAFRARRLKVKGWYSTNLLGNEDGRTLQDPRSHKAKQKCKSDLLEQILGYDVSPHMVQINYYPPRGDNKEAWDNIDLAGFLGKKMSLKINFLCRDSILAAPLVIDLVRFMDLAARAGETGPQEWLSFYFKAPYAEKARVLEQGFIEQYKQLIAYVFSKQTLPG